MRDMSPGKRAKPGVGPGFVWFRDRRAAPGNGMPSSGGFFGRSLGDHRHTLPKKKKSDNAPVVNWRWTAGEPLGWCNRLKRNRLCLARDKSSRGRKSLL
jgi:hypothetical protein